MTSTKHPTKAEKTRNECKLLAEVAGLKENNRELAKSLAEKRKENIELREMQNKYVILENKLKINQKLHLSSISRLETFLIKTSSQLFEVVESISSIHKTLHDSMKSVMLEDSDKKKEKKTIVNEESLTLEDTHILEHISDVLKNITSRKQFNTDKKETNILSPQKIFEENPENVIECSTKELDPLPEVENNLINDLTKDCYFCKSETLNQSKADIYSCSQNKHILNIAAPEKFTSDGVTSTSPNVSDIPDEASQLDKTETTVVYVNGAQHINDVSVMGNSIEADTYHYSQDENFQNFLADEETIIRRGVDQSLVIPDNPAIPLISMENNNEQFISHAQEKVLRTSGLPDVEHQEDEQQSENHIMSLKLLARSANLANTLTRNEVKEKVKSNASEHRGVEFHRKYPIILQNPVPINTKMQTSCKYLVAETEERRTTKLFNTSPGREGKDNYSQCFTNSNFFQSLEQHNCIFNRTVRRSGDKNEYTIYCDSSSPNADTEKYLRRYQTLVNLNEIDNLNDVSRPESCSGKENTHSLTLNKEFRQTFPVKEFSRKPFQDRRNSILSGVENIFNSFKKRDIQDALVDGNDKNNSKICSKGLLSQNTKEDSSKTKYPKKKIAKRGRKKPRLRKKEDLRL